MRSLLTTDASSNQPGTVRQAATTKRLRFGIPLFVAARAERVGRVDAGVPAYRRPLRW